MANLRERKIRLDEAAKVGREKATDTVSVEQMIDQRGHHVTGQQLGNVGNIDLRPPLTEQEKRNRAISEPPTEGEALTRGNAGAGPRPSEPAEDEKVPSEIGFQSRPSTPSRTGQVETRPSHP